MIVNAHWLEVFRAFYPLVITMVSLAGLGLISWLATKFASKADTDAIKKTASDHETRIQLLEEACAASPTRQELQDGIGNIGQRMASVETSIKGVDTQLKTVNQYLHTIIDKAMDRVGK